ncbi:MAG: hypothetical protein WC795_03435 [Candidatus Paceibacterota bacterium]|jgi:hypothetical protein
MNEIENHKSFIVTELPTLFQEGICHNVEVIDSVQGQYHQSGLYLHETTRAKIRSILNVYSKKIETVIQSEVKRSPVYCKFQLLSFDGEYGINDLFYKTLRAGFFPATVEQLIALGLTIDEYHSVPFLVKNAKDFIISLGSKLKISQTRIEYALAIRKTKHSDFTVTSRQYKNSVLSGENFSLLAYSY